MAKQILIIWGMLRIIDRIMKASYFLGTIKFIERKGEIEYTLGDIPPFQKSIDVSFKL